MNNFETQRPSVTLKIEARSQKVNQLEGHVYQVSEFESHQHKTRGNIAYNKVNFEA